MKFETEHGCVVSEMATAYGNSKQIGRYAIAAAMNEVLTRAERVDQMEIRVCAPLEEKKTHDTWQEGFLNIFEAVLANKPFVMNVYRCVDRAQVEKYLKPLTDNLLMGVIDERAEGITVREEDKEFIARVYSYVFIGIMLDWIKDDMKADPKLIVDKLAILMKDSLADALRRFRI